MKQIVKKALYLIWIVIMLGIGCNLLIKSFRYYIIDDEFPLFADIYAFIFVVVGFMVLAVACHLIKMIIPRFIYRKILYIVLISLYTVLKYCIIQLPMAIITCFDIVGLSVGWCIFIFSNFFYKRLFIGQ